MMIMLHFKKKTLDKYRGLHLYMSIVSPNEETDIIGITMIEGNCKLQVKIICSMGFDRKKTGLVQLVHCSTRA